LETERKLPAQKSPAETMFNSKLGEEFLKVLLMRLAYTYKGHNTKTLQM
jgi:hypothetical protein